MYAINVGHNSISMLLLSFASSYVEMEKDLYLNAMMVTQMMVTVVVWTVEYKVATYAEGVHPIQMIVVLSISLLNSPSYKLVKSDILPKLL